MNRLKYGIPVIFLGLGVGAAFLFSGKKADKKAGKENDNLVSPSKQLADEERKKLMSELGKKGAAKSAAVRRAKKKEREAEKKAELEAAKKAGDNGGSVSA